MASLFVTEPMCCRNIVGFMQERKSKKSKRNKHRDRDRDSDRERSPAPGGSPRAKHRHDSPDAWSDVEIIERGSEPDLEALRREARQAMARSMSMEDRR